MKRGRKPIIQYTDKEINVDVYATKQAGTGAYTVESLKQGLCYFINGDTFTICTATGCAEMRLATAKVIAKELPEILREYTNDQKEGRRQMSTRQIQRMLRE